MFMKRNERLKKVIDALNLTSFAFAKKADVNSSTIYRALDSDGDLASESLEKILRTYPEVSADFLLREEGTPLRSGGDVYLIMLEERIKTFESLQKLVNQLAKKE